jgi:hypothetical protein
MAVLRANMVSEIARINAYTHGLDARRDPKNGLTGLFNILVRDTRVEKDNEGLRQIDADVVTARLSQRPGDWFRNEPGSGGASDFPRSDTGSATGMAEDVIGGGPTDSI